MLEAAAAELLVIRFRDGAATVGYCACAEHSVMSIPRRARTQGLSRNILVVWAP